MSRLTDEQVRRLTSIDNLCERCDVEECADAAMAALAREVQEWRAEKGLLELVDLAQEMVESELYASRAARLRCPTCKGTGWQRNHGPHAHGRIPDCPDCIDGYLSYADSMKLLLDTLARAIEAWEADDEDADPFHEARTVLALIQETT